MTLIWTNVLGDTLLWHIRWVNGGMFTFCGEKPGGRVADPTDARSIDQCQACSTLVIWEIIKYISLGNYQLAHQYRLAPK